MILVDTSVWVDHLAIGDPRMASLLQGERVVVHPFVIGEIACGNLSDRAEIMHLLGTLPAIAPARHDEVLALLDAHRLWGRGIGWVDVHLLAAAAIAGTALWTRDQRLAAAARGIVSLHNPGSPPN
ncbi:MAG: type II toxin-antitoxin system VapC family toxin [Phycisphaerales bacterium]